MTASSTTSEELLVEARGVTVQYRMQESRTSTLKEFVLAKLSGKASWKVSYALKNAALTVGKGECVALIGHNGCGKSTFLKVLAGILKPIEGEVAVRGRVAPLIELGAGFDPELTGRENVFLSCSLMGLSRKEIEDRMDSIAAFAELGAYFDQPVKTYSSGMYMRLGFSCSTAIDAELLLIDEILAVGDENFQKKCFERLHRARREGVSLVLVTHDLNVVRQIADRALVIDHGEIQYEGDPRLAVDFYLDLMEKARIAALPEAVREELKRQTELKKNDRIHRDFSRGDAKISRVAALGKNGSLGVLTAGEPWTLEIEIDVLIAFPDPPVVGYAVRRPDGLRIFGSNTKANAERGTPTPQSLKNKGRHVVRFCFDGLSLASGTYSVIAAVHNHGLEATIEIIEIAGAIRVVDPNDEDNFDADLLAANQRSRTVEFIVPPAP